MRARIESNRTRNKSFLLVKYLFFLYAFCLHEEKKNSNEGWKEKDEEKQGSAR